MILLALTYATASRADEHGDPGQGPTEPLVRSRQSGRWSDAATWDRGIIPAPGNRVQIAQGHHVLYDIVSDQAIRSLHIAGTLSFAPDRDTRLEVGLIRIQAGDDLSEEGFECDTHVPAPDAAEPRPALEIGTVDRPIDASHTALVRLVYFEGMDKQSLPAIVCCSGRMDLHGATLNRTWMKLDEPANAGDASVTLSEPVSGWRIGDRVIVTSTTRQNKQKKTFRPSVRDSSQTEERLVRSIDGQRLLLDRPLEFDHRVEADYRGEVANLSRNVTIESADPETARGHTMIHRGSAGSISYAEFRHLGKEGTLGRYSLHYHLVGDSMRGTSVTGASLWDSGNRWITIHGTNYLVVRDCVGYQSVGHGFFLEDGTEVFNVLDRNLAVQAMTGKPLPKQVLPFDKNDGSGFWWANSLNTFTRNVAAECDEYGYFFQAPKTAEFDPVRLVQQPDGSRKHVDVRTLPFVRFQDNESHCQRRHSFNLGGGVPFGEPNVAGVGPDAAHPFIIRNLRLWDVHWGIHPVSPSVLLDRLDIYDAEYGVWRPVYNRHAYRELTMTQVPNETRFAFVSGRPDNDESRFPEPLHPVDDLAPITVITRVQPGADGALVIHGTTTDDGVVAQVVVNRVPARATSSNFSEWEVTLTDLPAGRVKLVAQATDDAGNVESRPHELWLSIAAPSGN